MGNTQHKQNIPRTIPVESNEEINIDDDGVNYDVATLVLQALQVDPRQVQVYDEMTVGDLYFYHFEEKSRYNDQLFEEMLNHARRFLGINIGVNSTAIDIMRAIENLAPKAETPLVNAISALSLTYEPKNVTNTLIIDEQPNVSGGLTNTLPDEQPNVSGGLTNMSPEEQPNISGDVSDTQIIDVTPNVIDYTPLTLTSELRHRNVSIK